MSIALTLICGSYNGAYIIVTERVDFFFFTCSATAKAISYTLTRNCTSRFFDRFPFAECMITCCRDTHNIRSGITACAVTWLFTRVLAISRSVYCPLGRIIVTELFDNAVFYSSASLAFSVLCTVFRAGSGCIRYPFTVWMYCAFCINSISLDHKVIFIIIFTIIPEAVGIICIIAFALVGIERVCKPVHIVAEFTVNSCRTAVICYFCNNSKSITLLYFYGWIKL